MAINVTIKGKKMIIEADITESTSKSGKSTVIASTGGNVPTTAQYNGKTVIVGLNAYVKKDQ